MQIITILLSLFINIIPPSDFECNGSKLHSTIYNNFKDKQEVTQNIENLDEGSFIVLEWRDYEIEIPITKYGSVNFANTFWKWNYINEEILDIDHPSLSRQYPTGKIVTYSCKPLS